MPLKNAFLHRIIYACIFSLISRKIFFFQTFYKSMRLNNEQRVKAIHLNNQNKYNAQTARYISVEFNMPRVQNQTITFKFTASV